MSTSRTFIEGKTPVTLPMGVVRATEIPGPLVRLSKDPIMVLKNRNYYYIIDGNHRYAYAQAQGKLEIKAFILEGRDRRNIRARKGHYVSPIIQDWVDGFYTMIELKQWAMHCFRNPTPA